MPAPAHRPTLLSDALRKQLCGVLGGGVDRRNACESVGIGLRTFHRWLADGRARKSQEAVALLAHVQKAEADAVALHVGLIRRASENGAWQASAWWLERRHPDLYGSDRKRVR